MSAIDVASALGYTDSRNWVRRGEGARENAHLLRRAQDAGVLGTYVFRTSPEEYPLLPPRSVVHVAEAGSVEEAQRIHKRLWNLGDAPFIIIILPGEIRVYTGFQYDPKKDQPIKRIPRKELAWIAAALHEFNAYQIDSGRVWQRFHKHLSIKHRIDHHLLNNLRSLGSALIDERGIDPPVAHSLIGKYIYVRYLRERGILSDLWLEENGIDIQRVFGRHAELASFRELVNAIDRRFNGHVFPLPLEGAAAPTDDDIAFVSSVLLGDSASGQLSLDFQIYDFSYIPIELLSSIYEQFLHIQGKGKRAGAYYTPEPLAEYLLTEVNELHPLRAGIRILDPCCGSGVFLVLAYRQLIEQQLQRSTDGRLEPTELRKILTDSIFGVERNAEACFVTEFSLLLTMLSYIEPPELHRYKDFKFPELHNTQIFEQDFFDPEGLIWSTGERFDWVVGNPPWVELDPKDDDERHALTWMRSRDNRRSRPVARYRTSEAFTWRVVDLLAEGGYVGLIIHATSLSNDSSEAYRKAFFSQHYIAKVTNFSNLAYVLFEKRAEAPAATMIYSKYTAAHDGLSTIHYGPFVANQLPIRSQVAKRSWVITVYQNEISILDRRSFLSGSALAWKLALWGTYRDQKLLTRIGRMFPHTIKSLVRARGGEIALGIQLRERDDERSGDVEHRTELTDTYVLDPNRMNRSGNQYLVPKGAIVPNREYHIRTRGGSKGLKLIMAPHLVITPTYAAFSEEDFVLTHPRVGIAAPAAESDFLRALSVYLNSNIARYLAFFGSTSWGVDRSTFGLGDVEDIPAPEFSDEQITQLASLHREIARTRQEEEDEDLLRPEASSQADELTPVVARVLGLPTSLGYLADDFVNVKLAINKGKTNSRATQAAEPAELQDYAEVLREQLDSFAGIRHQIRIFPAFDFICCEIDSAPQKSATADVLFDTDPPDTALTEILKLLKSRRSQWVYVQRSFRVFAGNRLLLIKANRAIDWTRTQALLDSDDVIAEVLTHAGRGG